MSEIRVLVNGAKGRMGATTAQAVREADGLTLVGESDLGDDLAAALKESRAQVCVDFTHPDVALSNTLTILEQGVRPVVGTTGFSDDDIEAVRRVCADKRLGAVIAPNFAIGAVLMMRFARQAAPFFPGAEIIELHHDRKADAPSGTAMATAEMMARARNEPFPPDTCTTHAVQGARGGEVSGVRVHSVRLPGFLAHQEVILGDAGQVLTLRHDTSDRSCFMPGVIRATRAVADLDQLVVGLESILFPTS